LKKKRQLTDEVVRPLVLEGRRLIGRGEKGTAGGGVSEGPKKRMSDKRLRGITREINAEYTVVPELSNGQQPMGPKGENKLIEALEGTETLKKEK